MRKSVFSLFPVIFFFSLNQHVNGQSVFLDNEDGLYGDYGIISNSNLKGKVINGGYSYLGKYDIGFTYLHQKEDLESIFSAHFSVNIRDKKANVKSLGSVSFGMSAVENRMGVFGGLGYSFLFKFDKNLYFFPDIIGGFSILKLGNEMNRQIRVEPTLSLGASIAHENKFSYLYFGPGLVLTREATSFSISLGTIFKFANSSAKIDNQNENPSD